jgi:hypothetical protein
VEVFFVYVLAYVDRNLADAVANCLKVLKNVRNHLYLAKHEQIVFPHHLTKITTMSTKEAQDQLKREGEGALSTSEYWDKRYAQADGENATHEWFRSFSALLPFLQSNLFDTRPVDQKPKILHFGSGDSVSCRYDGIDVG